MVETNFTLQSPTWGPITLAYSDAGAGPAVILVHGFTGNRRFYRRVAFDLIKGGYRAISPDLRGHGESEKPTNRDAYHIETMAADLVGLLSHLEIGRCVLVGHSMGAFVAQEFALRYPERLLGLSLVDAGYGRRYASLEEQESRFAAFERVAHDSGLDGLFEMTWGHLPFRTEAQRASAIRLFKETTIEAFLGCQHGMNEWGSHLDFLPNIRVSTLLVAGANGPNLVVMSEMERLIPRARLTVIAGAGHNVFLDRPREFSQTLAEFLSEIT